MNKDFDGDVSKASSLQHMPDGSFLTAVGISYSEVRSDVQAVAGGKFLCVGDRRKDAAGDGGRI